MQTKERERDLSRLGSLNTGRQKRERRVYLDLLTKEGERGLLRLGSLNTGRQKRERGVYLDLLTKEGEKGLLTLGSLNTGRQKRERGLPRLADKRTRERSIKIWGSKYWLTKEGEESI